MKKQILLFSFLLCLVAVYAQKPLHIPLNIEKAYENETRDESGVPGSKYWQNSAVYKIGVKLDPQQSKISGNENVNYTNNSPDTLNQLVISLLSDILKKGNTNDFGIPLSSLNDGVIVEYLKINGEIIDLTSPRVQRRGTNFIVNLHEPLHPGKSLDVDINWSFIYPKYLTIRCGDYGDSTFFVAYFYPKISVYDDLDGWDKQSYTGFAEFYGDFSDYYVDITVPRNFKVWATGELMNANAVFTPAYYKKWLKAQESMEVFSMINKENYQDDDITKNNEWNTWQFKAEGVPDFAFGSSDKFLWDVINVVVDERTGRKTTLNAAYRVDSEDYYNMAKLGKKVLLDFSTRIPGIPYPFPEMTIFNGNSGMEFPMMCNNVSCEPWHETAGLAYHEVAHTYFPFYVGTNERKYAWMDEGWASLLPYFFFEEHSPDFDYFNSRMERYYQAAGLEIEVPSMTPGNILTVRAPYRQASYNKPFFSYYYLYVLLGEELFTSSLQHYMKSWAGKHPMPYDFFYSFNTASGQNLNWYWQNWFFDRNHADLSIREIKDNQVIIENIGGLFLPVEIEVIYGDDKSVKTSLGLEVWKDGATEISIPVKDMGRVKKIKLGNHRILDVDQENNVMEMH